MLLFSSGIWFFNRPTQLVHTLTVAVALILSPVVCAKPISKATPKDNQKLAITLGALGGTHVGATLIALVPSPIAPAASRTEAALNAGLKAVPPVLEVPDNQAVYPNTQLNGYACLYNYNLPQTEDSYRNDLTFFTTDPIEENWGPLGTPTVLHANSPVKLHLYGLPEGQQSIESGQYPLTWEAATQFSMLVDVGIPAVLDVIGTRMRYKSKVKHIAKVKKIRRTYSAAEATRREINATRIWLLQGLGEKLLTKLALYAKKHFGVGNGLLDDYEDSAINSAQRNFTVWDVQPPYFRDSSSGSVVQAQTVYLEASDYGGAQFNKKLNQDKILGAFKALDNCGRSLNLRAVNPPLLIPISDAGEDVTWVVSDEGPYNVLDPHFSLSGNQTFVGDNVVTTLTQRIIVQDTQSPLLVPPEGFAYETTQDIDPNGTLPEGFKLGKPRISDLADPRPQYSSSAPAIFQAPDPNAGETGRRYVVQYSATDFSGNVTASPSDDPEKYAQIVTLKLPGTNTPPTASDAMASTITSEPVTIQLRGEDTDFIDGRFDPLKFDIVNEPANGGFVAPLLPYFIEDLRLTPESLPIGESYQNIACPNDLNSSEELEGKLGLVSRIQHGNYIVKCYCQNGSPTHVQPPMKYIYDPQYVHITDDNVYYINDQPMQCDYLNPGEPIWKNYRRVSKWIDGVWQADFELKGQLKSPVIDIDRNNHLWWFSIPEYQSNLHDGQILYSVDENLQPWYSSSTTDGSVYFYKPDSAAPDLIGFGLDSAAHVDSDRGLIYINDQRYIYVFDLSEPSRFLGKITDNGNQILQQNSLAIPDPMVTDSDGNLYVTGIHTHRIHKIAAPSVDGEGNVTLGDYVGWVGLCTDNIGLYNNCDIINQRSKGFQCTDQTCTRPTLASGSAPGQFYTPVHIAIDPNDILYVADRDNDRIQRFYPDGTFAGEAKSTGAGVSQTASFVLGNMGKPQHVSVNSTSFNVLERDYYEQSDDYFLHIFKTTPLYDITDHSAKVDYVSAINFQGQDSFTYSVDDGIAQSAPATVSVDVSRAYRAPYDLTVTCFSDEAMSAAVDCALAEDTQIYVHLIAKDLDGFIGYGDAGLDSLNFSVAQAPSHGTIQAVSHEVNQALYLYTPDADYYGDESITFSVDDGAVTIEQPVTQSFTVAPVYDPPVVDLDSSIVVPHGFSQRFSVNVTDVDQNPDKKFVLHFIDFGDDGLAYAGGSHGEWIDHGLFDSEGVSIHPVVDLVAGKSVINFAHTWQSASSPLKLSYQGGIPGQPSSSEVTASLTVKDIALLDIYLNVPEGGVMPDTDFEFGIQVTNLAPDGWSGLTASGVTAQLDAVDGLTISQRDSRCAAPDSNGAISCTLADLAPGASSTLMFTGSLSLAMAREAGLVQVEIQASHNGPHLDDSKPSRFWQQAIEAQDSDGDGTIDVDDAYVNDFRYSADSDGDGMADSWEEQYGLNPQNPADAALDSDGDGMTNIEEFVLNNSPLLANDVQTVHATTPVDTGQNGLDDNLGFRIASADVNGDGYTDIIAGAPTLLSFNGQGIEGTGAVMIFHGSAGGLEQTPEILGSNGPSDFGRAVTVNDFDGNGYPDIAVGFEAARGQVYLFMNGPNGFNPGGELLAQPEVVISADTTVNFGAALYSSDVDNDGRADLLISANGYDGNLGADQGAVYVYLAKDAYYDNASPSPSVVLEGPVAGSAIGEGMSIGEIDGDNDRDLVIGAGRTGTLAGQIFIYRGKDIQWSAGDPIIPSQVISVGTADDRYGYSVSVGGDINGDKIDDLLVGAYGDTTKRGAAYLYLSSSQYWLQSTPLPDQTFNGVTDGDQLGVNVAILPDMNGDGFDDAVIGANRSETDSIDQGEARLLLGSSTGLTQLTTTHGLVDEMLGYSISDAGDINGDSRRDYVVGAPMVAASGAGQIYPFLGGAAASELDSDFDQVGDTRDNCPSDANTAQQDMDGDAVGDACDTDTDGDSWLNESDNCPEVANLDQLDTDQDLVGNVCDDDDDGDGVADVDDPFPLNALYSVDTDSDGLPDEYETQYGLNLNDSSDALQDLDGDGRNNVDEFTTGSNILADDVPPQLSAPADLVINSIGPLTAVDPGSPTANDVHDGAVTASVDQLGPFTPGHHVLNWTASDAAGNSASAQQSIDVIPQLTLLGREQISAEGAVVVVELQLNGDPVSWPVSVPFTVSGTADASDYTILTPLSTPNTLDFNEPSRRSTLQIELTQDGLTESDETLIVTLATPHNAINGEISVYTIHIVNSNVAPQVSMQIVQQGEQRSSVYSNQGTVVATATIKDPNTTDSHNYDWSASDSALIPTQGFSSNTFSFDPSTLAAGIYHLSVSVTDSGSPAESATTQHQVKVLASAPTLSTTADSDGDGVSDATEGLADDDADGVPNYLDSLDSASWLPRDASSQAPLQTEPGLRLVLGETAFASGHDATVSFADLAAHGDSGGIASLTDDGLYDFPGDIFDFEIQGLFVPGATAKIVLPLKYPIPAGTSYRKYLADTGWQDFVEDTLNRIQSATGAEDACPPPGSSDYTDGLNTGANCVQLQISDGGPNDADGEANQIIRDPGGVAVTVVVTTVAVNIGNQTIDAGTSNVVLLRLQLNSNSSLVSLHQLNLEGAGSGNDHDDISVVKLWQDANDNGLVDSGDVELGNGSYLSDNGNLQLQLTTPLPLKVGTINLLVTYDF